MGRMLLAFVAFAVIATQASARQCPMLAAQIEQALAAADVPEGTRMAATALAEAGMRLHDLGDHAASEAALAVAMQLLGIAPG